MDIMSLIDILKIQATVFTHTYEKYKQPYSSQTYVIKLKCVTVNIKNNAELKK